jgi:hypothetical protein
MAAGNATLYSAAVLGLGSGSFSLGSDNYNIILATTSYVPAVNADSTYANVSGFEVVAGGGYTLGGQALSGISWTQGGATSTFAAQSAVWSGATIAARYGIIIRRASIALASTDKLLCFADLTGGGNGVATASTFQINWNNASTPSSANTIFTLTHNP